MLNWLSRPVRLKKIYKEYKDQSFTLLDIGCGNHSPSQTKRYFPHCTYHGLDVQEYNIDASDYKAMDHFYKIDLDTDSLSHLPDNFYDVIIMSHVLEHLAHPYQTLNTLCSKLRPGGKIYLEFPSLRSFGFPSMEGTLQFCDDGTHIFMPNPYEVANLLLKNGIAIKKSRIRRDFIRFCAGPFFLLNNLRRRLLGKRFNSRGLWDLWGFAHYVYGEKKSCHPS
jgi:2-polyprenyl-3-methyl-5-hydroxy-6-metoxy-1,4-benzoquinol methylase